jgi:hypothetical protein
MQKQQTLQPSAGAAVARMPAANAFARLRRGAPKKRPEMYRGITGKLGRAALAVRLSCLHGARGSPNQLYLR